jgi:GMP synthase-like glutamine amidotransferase
MHQDHVPSVPHNFHLLGSTPVSINQGMVRFYGDRAPRSANDIHPDDIHILTLQGHPEFTEPIVTGLVEKRSASGVMDMEAAKDAMERRYGPNDGVGIIGHAVWNVIGRV